MTITNINSQLGARPIAATVTGYILVFIIACLLFSYIRFPAEVFKPFVVTAARDSGFNIDILDMNLSFPPGIAMSGVEIKSRRSGAQKINLQSLNVRPALTAALFGVEKYILSSTAYAGSAQANVEVGENGRDIKAEFSFANLDPGKAEFLQNFKWATVTASLSGSGDLDLPEGLLIKGSSDIEVTLDGASITLGKIISPDSLQIALDTGTANIELKGGRIKFNRFEISGPQLEITLTGDVGLATAPQFSRLALTMTVNMDEGLVRRLGPMGIIFSNGEKTFRIGGTLQNPVLR